MSEDIVKCLVGDLLSLWEKQRSACVGNESGSILTQEHFIHHLLNVHKTACLQRLCESDQTLDLSQSKQPEISDEKPLGPLTEDDSNVNTTEHYQQEDVHDETAYVKLSKRKSQPTKLEASDSSQKNGSCCETNTSKVIGQEDQVANTSQESKKVGCLPCQTSGCTCCCTKTENLSKFLIPSNMKNKSTKSRHAVPSKEEYDPKKPHRCPVCSKAFQYRNKLLIHYMIHTGDKPFKCEYCSKSFRKNDHLTRHMHTHTQGPPEIQKFICAQCGDRFRLKTQLKKHLTSTCSQRILDLPKTVQKSADGMCDTSKLCMCPVCCIVFISTVALSEHMTENHSDIKKYECQLCPAVYTQAGSLREHMTMHTGDRDHQCADCGRCFARARYLHVHQLTHSGEKLHKCPQCPKKFSRRNTLARHQATVHEKHRPYQCDVDGCEQTFSRRYLLVKHLNSHVKGTSKCNDVSTDDQNNNEEKSALTSNVTKCCS